MLAKLLLHLRRALVIAVGFQIPYMPRLAVLDDTHVNTLADVDFGGVFLLKKKLMRATTPGKAPEGLKLKVYTPALAAASTPATEKLLEDVEGIRPATATAALLILNVAKQVVLCVCVSA